MAADYPAVCLSVSDYVLGLMRVQCFLTTQISACLQEQVGLMSISSWTLSFSSSPRTWLNFFIKSWAFPASGRFSKNTRTWRFTCYYREPNQHSSLGFISVFPTHWQYSSASPTWLHYWPQTAIRIKKQVQDILEFWKCDVTCMHVSVDNCSHHWKLVKIEELFHKASEHVLTLPHLI